MIEYEKLKLLNAIALKLSKIIKHLYISLSQKYNYFIIINPII